ncbi:MAG: universal stress protein [Candidatus Methanofastidiosum sp.]|nr:universal stress protein [Methanofastidiosum sp.]NYT04076.1 universal stress protein [Candidatus Methanofastidiosa archaeon]NYT13408.1 universal stress protein [Candidatus Methanofastidiosa archaeon]
MKILMCTDGSFYSDSALAYGAQLFCNLKEHEVTILYVMPKVHEEFKFYERKFEEEVRKLKEVELKNVETVEELKNLKPVDVSVRILEGAYKLMMKFGFDAKTKARSGNPADEILREAEEENYELIVMGQYGFSKSNKASLGKVASIVVKNSKIPVLIVK